MCDHPYLGVASGPGDIQHAHSLSDNIGALFMQEDYSDMTLLVENEQFPAHKVILAARSEYFRALLYGGMKESQSNEVELKATPARAFRHLLAYIYTARINLREIKEEILLEILGLANQYGFTELEFSISDFLKAVLNIQNVCLVFDIANLYSLPGLCQACFEFMDRHASDIIASPQFLTLSSSALKEIISRDSFCASEIDIFSAVKKWANGNPDEELCDILKYVRLPLMSLDELLNLVRSSNIISSDTILDAIKVKNESRDMELNYRGFIVPEENIAALRYDTEVLQGEMKSALLDGDCTTYDLDRGFTRHPIEDGVGQGIVVKLGMPYIINTIRLLLWDRDSRSYSYHIDVSMDNKDWEQIINYDHFLCRSWQYLRFPPRVVQYVRVVGTHNTVNRVFHLVSLECLYSRSSVNMENGVIVTKENVASREKHALVIEGVSRTRNALINGNKKDYDWDSGYTCHQLGSGAIVVQLAQPYIISSMRLLLWDCDSRSYSYYVEVCTNQSKWHTVTDRTNQPCRSWQTITFEKQVVTFIRIVGTHNTANEVFHCVHFESPADNHALREIENEKGDHAGDSKAVSTAKLPQIPVSVPAAAVGPQPEAAAANQQPARSARQSSAWAGQAQGGYGLLILAGDGGGDASSSSDTDRSSSPTM